MDWNSGNIRIPASRRAKIDRETVKDSTPGYPWSVLASDNEALEATNGDFLWQEVERRMNFIVDNFDRIMVMSPVELVQSGAADPVKLFVKKEPHSAKKVASGMSRIIASVSIAYQKHVKLISMRQNKMEIIEWKTCPSKPGMGLHDEGLGALAGTALNMLEKGKILATDVSTWDWTVQDWELGMDAERRIKLAGIDDTHAVAKLLRAHAHIVANSVFVDADGNMFAQIIPGGQLSGDYNTSATNSAMRVMATMVARHRVDPLITQNHLKDLDICSMGDDTLELDYPGVPGVLEEIGHIVKDSNLHATLAGLDFCSQTFLEDGTAAPSDPYKTFFRFLSHPPDDNQYPAYLAQLRWTFRHLDKGILEKIEATALARVERARKTQLGL